MKLVGGDSGRVEHESLIIQVLLGSQSVAADRPCGTGER